MATEPARQRPLTYWIGEVGGWLLRHVVSGLAATGITPNMFTFLGLAVNSWAAALFAMGMFRQAAAVLFLAGFLDMAGGEGARGVGKGNGFWRVFGFDFGPLFGSGFVHGIGGALHADRAAVLYGAGGGGDG